MVRERRGTGAREGDWAAPRAHFVSARRGRIHGACGVEGGGSRWQTSQGARRCRVIGCVSLHRRSRDARRASRIASTDLVPPSRWQKNSNQQIKMASRQMRNAAA